MTHHFVNLISWEFFVDNRNSNFNKKLKIDSLSLSIMVKLFGYNNNRVSGLKFYNENNFENAVFLVSSITGNFTNSFVLPFWKNINDGFDFPIHAKWNKWKISDWNDEADFESFDNPYCIVKRSEWYDFCKNEAG